MFTNRDEVLEKALRIFAKMNYEKASQMEIARTCGLSKAGLTYYFPFKQDLFTAVADRYVFDTQHSKNKFNFTAGSLSEFIDRYVAGVENTMPSTSSHQYCLPYCSQSPALTATPRDTMGNLSLIHISEPTRH